MKNIKLLALGGTITYSTGGNESKSAEDLVKDLGTLPENVSVDAEDLFKKASSSLLMEDLFLLVRQVFQCQKEGYHGVVITMGTDTMEEVAFLLDLAFNTSIPVVITGSMRHKGQRGSEVESNLFDAIMVASTEEFAHLGCMVLMNEEIHPAKYVKKMHTQNPAAFHSQFGPCGYIAEGKPKLVMLPVKEKDYVSLFEPIWSKSPALVCQVVMSVGEPGGLLDYVDQAGYNGIVVEGLGGGHVPDEVAVKLRSLTTKMPVIMCSRTGNGEVFENTYQGYPGSEVELIKAGCIYAGILDAAKARILLCLLLTREADLNKIKSVFQEIG